MDWSLVNFWSASILAFAISGGSPSAPESLPPPPSLPSRFLRRLRLRLFELSLSEEMVPLLLVRFFFFLVPFAVFFLLFFFFLLLEELPREELVVGLLILVLITSFGASTAGPSGCPGPL
mmetsp:Transcript_59571/g.192761  ORF Transcript_59571/g.192761 Transcript_59571/m.192761 type:complete len:120 (-) Transcript_59571:312-671(-)